MRTKSTHKSKILMQLAKTETCLCDTTDVAENVEEKETEKKSISNDQDSKSSLNKRYSFLISR